MRNQILELRAEIKAGGNIQLGAEAIASYLRQEQRLGSQRSRENLKTFTQYFDSRFDGFFWPTQLQWIEWQPSKNYVHVTIPGTVNVTLFGKRDIIKLRILRWSYPGLAVWALNPMTSISLRDSRGETQMKSRPCEEGAETRVMQPQARSLLEQPEAGRGKEASPQSLWREHRPTYTFMSDFWLPEQ